MKALLVIMTILVTCILVAGAGWFFDRVFHNPDLAILTSLVFGGMVGLISGLVLVWLGDRE